MNVQNPTTFPQEEMQDVENQSQMDPALSMQSEPADQPAPDVKSAPKRRKAEGAVYVGRITLGLALVAIGVLITASLFVPNINFLTVAKFAPLVLVLVGVEILIGAARSKGRPVKVGFGLSLICLFLIFGAVAAAMLPDIWTLYGPGNWEREEAIRRELTQSIYDRVDLSVVNDVQVNVYNTRPGQTPEANVHMNLLGDYEDESQFAADSLTVIKALKGLDLEFLDIQGWGKTDLWYLRITPKGNLADLTPEQLQKRVGRDRIIRDAELNQEQISQQRYEEMKEDGLLVDVAAVEAAHSRGYQEGFEKAQQELANEKAEEELPPPISKEQGDPASPTPAVTDSVG